MRGSILTSQVLKVAVAVVVTVALLSTTMDAMTPGEDSLVDQVTNSISEETADSSNDGDSSQSSSSDDSFFNSDEEGEEQALENEDNTQTEQDYQSPAENVNDSDTINYGGSRSPSNRLDIPAGTILEPENPVGGRFIWNTDYTVYSNLTELDRGFQFNNLGLTLTSPPYDLEINKLDLEEKTLARFSVTDGGEFTLSGLPLDNYTVLDEKDEVVKNVSTTAVTVSTVGLPEFSIVQQNVQNISGGKLEAQALLFESGDGIQLSGSGTQRIYWNTEFTVLNKFGEIQNGIVMDGLQIQRDSSSYELYMDKLNISEQKVADLRTPGSGTLTFSGLPTDTYTVKDGNGNTIKQISGSQVQVSTSSYSSISIFRQGTTGTSSRLTFEPGDIVSLSGSETRDFIWQTTYTVENSLKELDDGIRMDGLGLEVETTSFELYIDRLTPGQSTVAELRTPSDGTLRLTGLENDKYTVLDGNGNKIAENTGTEIAADITGISDVTVERSVSNTGTTGGGENYIFVTENELQKQKQRVQNGEEPWQTSYNKLISKADSSVGRNLKAVTDDDGDHIFSRENNRHDYRSAMQMSKSARDCGIAYWFTGEDKYAECTTKIIHHWALKDSTYMKPTTRTKNPNSQVERSITQWITMPAFAYAASFVRGHPSWDRYDGSTPWDGGSEADAEAAFQEWVRDRYQTYEQTRVEKQHDNWCQYDNKWQWRIADRAAMAAYLQDDAKLQKAFDMWRAQDETYCENIDDNMPRPWGTGPYPGTHFVNEDDAHAFDGTADPAEHFYSEKELSRDPGFDYSAYGIKALTMTALIAERWDGTDLWSYNAPTDDHSGSSLKKAYDWMADYTKDTSRWKWDVDGNVEKGSIREATSTFEHAYARWGEFKSVLDNPDKINGRPHRDRRLLGQVTLTHGEE